MAASVQDILRESDGEEEIGALQAFPGLNVRPYRQGRAMPV